MQGTVISVAGYWMSTLVRLFYNPCLPTLWIRPAEPSPSLSISKPLSAKEERGVTYPTVMLSLRAALPMRIP